MKNKINKIKHINTYDILAVITLTILSMMLCVKSVHVDSWYIAKNGENLLKYGFYTNDLLLMHKNLDFINQHWIMSILFYYGAKIFGMFTFNKMNSCILSSLAMIGLYILNRKTCKENKLMAFLITIIQLIVLFNYDLLTNRVNTLSLAVLALFIYNLEKFDETMNKKYIIWNIILSIAEINLHMSIWWILIIALMPYCFNFKFNAKASEKKRFEFQFKKNLIYMGITAATLITGLINPYGFKGMTYIFRCGIDEVSKTHCLEFWSVLVYTERGQYVYTLILIIVVLGTLFYFKKYKNIEMKYLYFGFGGLLMSFIAVRNMYFTTIFCGIYIVYLLRNVFITSNFKKGFAIISITAVIISAYLYSARITCAAFNTQYQYGYEGIEKVLDEYCNDKDISKDDLKIYSYESIGGYLEYFGFHPFEDCRNEATRKQMNGIHDYYKESTAFRDGLIDCSELLEKYDIDVIVIHKEGAERIIKTNEKYFNNNWKLYYTSEMPSRSKDVLVYTRKQY